MESFDWHVGAAALSGILGIASLVPYVRDVLRGGDTKPNAVSFFLWTVLEAVALIAQLKAGTSWSLVVVAAVTFNTGFVTVLAIIGYGYREYGKVDLICFVLAVIAIVLLVTTNQPVLAILLSIVGDMFAAIPTLVKTYHDPRSEHALSWFIITLSGLFGILSTEIFNTANLAYPIYSFLMCGSIFSFAYFGRKFRAR